MRKLVSVKPITELRPIPEADAIQCAIVDNGWPVVVKIGEFQVGDDALYFEIDSFLPLDNPVFEFLHSKKSKLEDGREGIRLRSIRLRKQLSQGLLLPISFFPEVESVIEKAKSNNKDYYDADFSFMLNVVKYEPPVPASLGGQAKGSYPFFIRKTDQERCQSLYKDIFVNNIDSLYEVTLKLDGSSFTAYYKSIPPDEIGEDGLPYVLGVCSRNLNLTIDDPDNIEGNAFVKTFYTTKLNEALPKLGRDIAIQGELMGNKIQGNRENINGYRLFVFDIFDIDKQEYVAPEERYNILLQLQEYGFTGEHVPILHESTKLPASTMDELLEYADGMSLNHKIREGLVYKRLDGQFSFKTISNQFLLKSEL